MVAEPNEAPIIYDPSTARATTEELEPLSAALSTIDSSPWDAEPVVYQRGTVRPGGVVDLCKQGLGPDGVRKIVPQAAKHPGIHHVLLGTNALGKEGVQTLTDSLEPDHAIETLYLGCNGIDGGAIAPLATYLATDETVKALWLKRNPLDDEGVAHIAEAVRTNQSLQTLDLVATGLSGNGLELLADALADNGSAPLQHLYLGANDLTSDDIESVAAVVSRAPSLTSFSMSGNPIGDDGLAQLAKTMTVLDRPLALMLSDCSLTPASSRVVGTLSTRALALSFDQQPFWIGRRGTRGEQNKLGDETANALGETISSGSCILDSLDISGNGLSTQGALAIAKAVEQGNHHLRQVRVGKGIAKSVRRRIKTALPDKPLPYPAELDRIRSRYR